MPEYVINPVVSTSAESLQLVVYVTVPSEDGRLRLSLAPLRSLNAWNERRQGWLSTILTRLVQFFSPRTRPASLLEWRTLAIQSGVSRFVLEVDTDIPGGRDVYLELIDKDGIPLRSPEPKSVSLSGGAFAARKTA